MSEENIYGRYHKDMPEPPAEPVQSAEEQLGGRFAAAAAKAAPAETPANEQFGGRFAAAAPAAPAEEPEPVKDAAFAMEESAAAETLLPAEAEVLPAVQGEVLPAVPKKKMSKKTLVTLLGIVAAVVLVAVLAVSGVFRPSDEKLMEKYTALAAEGDYEGIDELLHKASKWKRYQLVSDILELEYEAGNVYDFSDLLELLPAERQLLDFEQWYEAYQTALHAEFVSPWGVATSFGRVCDDFYRSGLLTREELIERCAAGEDRGDENLYGEYAALLGGKGAGKLLPVYCKSWESTAFVDYGLLAALPQEVRASSYEEADYVLECFYDRYADGRYRLGGTGYRLELCVRIVDLAGEVLFTSDSVRGSGSPSVIHYIGDAYGSEPQLTEYTYLVGDALYPFMASVGAEEEPALLSGSVERLIGNWDGDYYGADGSPDTATVTVEPDGKGRLYLDDAVANWDFEISALRFSGDSFSAELSLGDGDDTAVLEGVLSTDEDGDVQLEAVYVVYDISWTETDRTGAFVLEREE